MAGNAPYKTPTTQQEVREYVIGESAGLAQGEHTVTLNVSHSNLHTTRFAELRLDLRMSVSELKDRLYKHCGTRPSSMTVLLRDRSGKINAELTDENAKLGFYSAQNGDTLFVVDDDPNSASANGWLENTDLVEKYTISEEAYNKRANTYRKFRQEQLQRDPNWSMSGSASKNWTEADLDESNKPEMRVGDRVEVTPGGKRGEIRFVDHGLKDLPGGWWIGIRYDEPVGKNDGVVKGVRYFSAEKAHGALVRPSRVTVGDFPPLDDILDNDEEDEI